MSLGLDVRPETRPPIGEPLALDTLGGERGAFQVGHVAAVVAEIEFAQVSLQMFGAHPLIIAGDPTLEDREVALDGVGVPEAAAHIFLDRVSDGPVAAILAAGALVVTRFVGHEVGGAVDLAGEDWAKRALAHRLDVEGAH